MTKFRNLKIQINDKQPLDEVVRELERLGYKRDEIDVDSISVAAYFSSMSIDGYCNLDIYEVSGCELTTLAELKEME